jgi:hypothetical protein
MDGTVRPDSCSERAFGGWVRDPCEVSNFSRARLLWLAAVVLATAAGVLIVSEGDDDSGPPQPAGQQGVRPQRGEPASRQPPEAGDAQRADEQDTRAAVQQAVRSSPDPRLDPEQRRVVRAVRAYVEALNDRDGGRACGLFVPGALAEVEFPRDRGSCAASLSASIGFRDPRGFPVYDRSRIGRVPSVAIDGSEVTVVATTVTHFAGNREPSVEDDLIYLRNEAGRWLMVKPSATFYRAIGAGDIPPQVLAPP